MPYPTATIFLPYHALDDVVLRGPRSAQPPASAVVPGTLYSVTDEGPRLERSNGTAWELAAAVPGGGTATSLSYRFSTAVVAPPGGGQVRFNAAHPYTAVTQLWLTPETAGGNDAYWLVMVTGVGVAVVVQDEDDHTEYGRFETTAVPIDHGAYIELPVVWVANGSALANNAAVVLRIGAGGVVGPPTATDSALALFDGTTGKRLKDSAVPITSVARRDAANTFAQDQTIETSGAARLSLVDPSQPTDARRFQLVNSGQEFDVFALNDAATVVQGRVRIDRLGGLLATGPLSERARTTPLGEWVAIGFSAGNFSGYGGMTWTVAAGNVVVNRYTLIGKTLLWALTVTNSSVGGTLSGYLAVTVPVGVTLTLAPAQRLALAVDSGVPVEAMTTTISGTEVGFQKTSGAAWAASAGATSIYALFVLEVA